MRAFGSKYILESKPAWVAVGYNFKGIRLGFSITRYGLDIDLLFVWLSVEF